MSNLSGKRGSGYRYGAVIAALAIVPGIAAASAGPAMAATAAPGTASPAMAAQLRPVGTAPVIPAGGVARGRTRGSRSLRFDIVLAARHPAALQSLALAVSSPGSASRGKFLTVPQFAARFGQPAAAIRSAEAALRADGLRPGRAAADGLIIPVRSTVRQAETSLRTTFRNYRLNSGRVAYANTSAPRLPATVAAMTSAVVGLNDLVTPQTGLTRTRPAQGDAATGGAATGGTHRASATRAQAGAAGGTRAAKPASRGPSACHTVVRIAHKTNGWTYPQLARAYSLTSLYRRGELGGGTRIALFELDPWLRSDIAAFQRCYGTHVPLRVIKVDHGAGPGAGEGEAALDIETAIAMAPRVKLSVYDAPENQYALSTVNEYSRIIDDNTAQIISASYGICEYAIRKISPGLQTTENVLLQQAAVQGISVLVATGDTGSEGCYRINHSKRLAVQDLSTQPFVTAVGGTKLTAIRPGPAERVWNQGLASGNGAGGGGVSTTWRMPGYQSGPGVISRNSSGRPCGAQHGYCREVPDVSASADPLRGYVIYHAGSWTGGIGGTSAATPLWAAMVSDIESGKRPLYRAGFLNPLLYSTAASTGNGRAFWDVTKGSNDYSGTHGGKFPATRHYDMGSGLGAPYAPGLARAFPQVN
jgi:subtilase family serine protease